MSIIITVLLARRCQSPFILAVRMVMTLRKRKYLDQLGHAESY
jgi:hypothetical protein